MTKFSRWGFSGKKNSVEIMFIVTAEIRSEWSNFWTHFRWVIYQIYHISEVWKILYFIICFLLIWCFKSSLMFLVSFFQCLYHHSADYSKVCAPFQPKQDKLGVACHRGNCQNNSVEVWRGQLAGSTTPASACANFCWAWDFLGER